MSDVDLSFSVNVAVFSHDLFKVAISKHITCKYRLANGILEINDDLRIDLISALVDVISTEVSDLQTLIDVVVTWLSLIVRFGDGFLLVAEAIVVRIAFIIKKGTVSKDRLSKSLLSIIWFYTEDCLMMDDLSANSKSMKGYYLFLVPSCKCLV